MGCNKGEPNESVRISKNITKLISLISIIFSFIDTINVFVSFSSFLYTIFIIITDVQYLFIDSLASIFRNLITGCGRPDVSYHLLERRARSMVLERENKISYPYDSFVPFYRAVLGGNPAPLTVASTVPLRDNAFPIPSIFSAREIGILSIKY